MNALALEELTEDVLQDTYNHEELSNELSDSFNVGQVNIESDFIALERSLDLVESLESLKETISTKTELSLEDIKLIKIATEMAVSGTDEDATKLLPSLESYVDIKVATEGLGDVLGKAIWAIQRSIGIIFKNYADNIQFSYSYFNLQQYKVQSLKERLVRVKHQVGNTKVSFNVRSSKYTRFGGTYKDYHNDFRNVKDSKQYLDEFTLANDLNKEVLNKIGKFTSNSLFNTIKALAATLSNNEEHFKEKFKELEELFDDCLKIKGIKEYQPSIYTSNILLGLSYLSIIYPKGNYDKDSIRDMKKVVSNFDMKMIREDKFTTGISFTKITFNDVDVNYIEKLIAMCNESIKECLTFNTFINKLTVAGSSVTNDRSMSWVGLAMYILIANYRLALRSSSIVYTTAASSFNFSRGNISKALSIAEQAIINLEMVEKHKSK